MKLFVLMSALLAGSSWAAPIPDLDVQIAYYNKVLTPEGVTREARYEETMLRRDGHVWVTRVLPKIAAADAPQGSDAASARRSPAQARASATPVKLLADDSNEHLHFNHVMLARHVLQEHGKTRIEFVDDKRKEVVAVPPAEYENVNFDGSWDNANFLLDPKLLKTLPLSSRPSPVAGASWRESEQQGVFRRILWDEARQIPLLIETGDQSGTFYRRVEVKALPRKSSNLPWQNLKGYAHKEYADFLD